VGHFEATALLRLTKRVLLLGINWSSTKKFATATTAAASNAGRAIRQTEMPLAYIATISRLAASEL
jgi:hypothetical protein